jgi:uncharacterized membrane protein
MSENPKSKGLGAFHLADDLKLMLALTLVSVAFVLIPYLSDTALRTAIGLVFLLFVPGYAFIAALFPGKEDIDAIERVAFSLAVNLALVGLIGVGLNLSSWGVRVVPVVLSLMCLTLICIGAAWIRRQKLLPDDRFNVDFASVLRSKHSLLPEADVPLNRTVTAVFIVALIISAATIAYIMVVPPQRETFTEFYILGPGGLTTDYPTNYTLGEQKPITIGVINHESHDQQYVLEAQLDGGAGTTTLYSQQIALANSQSWEKTITLKPDQAGSHMKMEFLLYLNNNRSTPYQETHLWVNVTA